MRLPRLMIGLALISSFANLAAADDFQDRAFDAVSGRDIRNFPPDPQVKFNHLKLDLRMEKPESKSFSCTETITFTTLGKPLGWLDLNATDLKITSVKNSTGAPLDFRYDGEKLTIRFPKELAPATDAGVQIEYECQDPKGGMIFALPDAAYKDRPVIIHTQGEAEQSRNWFICHDSPNARFTTETLVTVPAKYLVVGNGKLVEKKDLPGGLVQYHHLMEQPHSAYLTSLVIGDLAVVTDQWRGRPVEYYAPKSMEPDLRRTFGKTPKMIELFSQLTGVDYPYAKYSQSVVWLFGAGGMENISATTLLETSVLDERRMLDSDSESLISHELAHQWFGDMVTCKSWQHLWLNEGFATFMAWVWAEHEQGPDEYTCQIYNTFRGIAESDSVDLSSGVVWPFYADPEETFGRPGSNPYPKGGSAIHMLRRSLGDELFWKCIGEYLRRYQWKTAETDDLRKVVDELSGQSYEQFFHQWLYRPGVPLIKVGYDWNEGAKEVRLTFEQTQKITKDAPVFEADVDVWLVMPDGTVTKHVAHMDTKTTGLTLKCDKEPAQVCIDPSISLLTQFDLKLPEPMLVRELKEGPTIGTRLHALHELQEKDSDAARDAMKIVLLDEKAPQGLRREVAAALGRNQQDGARQILLDSLAQGKAIADPRIRAAALRALGSYKNVDAAATLLRYARSDPAFGVEAAATSGLGRQKPTEEIIVTLLANTKKTGGADQIRIAAVSALAALEEPRGLDAAFELAAYGQAFRSRPPGIRALAQLGKKDDATSKKVRDFLENLLADPQSQSLEAAISALGTLSDPAAIPVLEKFTAGSAADAEKQSARRAIDAINRKTGDPAIISDLRSRIEKLEKEREDMEKKLQKLNKNQ